MRRLRGMRWWQPLVSVLTAAGVGVITNLATDKFSWALTAFLVMLVAVQMSSSVWQAARDQQDLRDARDVLLGQLRPLAPSLSDLGPASHDQSAGVGMRAVVHWLTAPFSPTPLWGRSTLHDKLVAWCEHRDPQAEVARVVAGPAGVGKSRLALAVAESLQEKGWAAGRLQGDGAELVQRIATAGDPTLVIVDDAVAAYRVAAGLFRQANDRYKEADTLGRLGDALHAAGEVDEATTTWARGADVLTEIGHAEADAMRARIAERR